MVVLLICCVCGLIWLDLGVCGVFLRWLICGCFGKVRFVGRFVRCIVCLFVCAACRWCCLVTYLLPVGCLWLVDLGVYTGVWVGKCLWVFVSGWLLVVGLLLLV